MRLYFHIVHQQVTISDPKGVEVENVKEARSEAFHAIAEMRQENSGYDLSGWTMVVEDSSGKLLFSIDLDADSRESDDC